MPNDSLIVNYIFSKIDNLIRELDCDETKQLLTNLKEDIRFSESIIEEDLK